MATIRIRNIGPIRDTGEVTLTRITLLLGPQGAGKSTLMKILCFCRWIEKEIMLAPQKKIAHYTRYKRFVKSLKSFYRLSDDFFSSSSQIEYTGDAFVLHWEGSDKQNVEIREVPRTDRRSSQLLHSPKISFVPAERNLVSAISNVDKSYRGSPWEDLLFNFVLELEEARKSYSAKAPLSLSIDESLEFYHSGGQHIIKMKELEKTLPAYYASSGIQSSFPIDVIANYLFNSIGQKRKITASDALRLIFAETDGESRDLFSESNMSELKQRHTYSSMQLYIEEPEQNLFPEAQKRLILNLLDLIHRAKDKETIASSLFITTHSPYLLSVINTQLAVARAYKYIEGLNDEGERQRRKQELDNFLGTNGKHLGSEEYSAYFIDNGGLTSLIQEPEEFPMIDGLDLDGVSDWVDDYNDNIRDIIYGDASL